MTASTRIDNTTFSSPIDSLWTQLHTAGYLSADNATLALPAQNTLGSAPIAALLGDATLFPKASLAMTLTSALPTSASIVLTGTLGGSFLNFAGPAAVATFTLVGGVAQLALAVSLPDGAVLGTAWPGLGTTAPAVQPFRQAALTASTQPASPSLAFSGTPVPDPSYAGLWSGGPGAINAPITGWSSAVPTMSLATPALAAAYGAGMLPMTAQVTFTSGPGDAGTGQVVATIATEFGTGAPLATRPLPVHFPLPVASGGVLLDSGPIAVPVGNLSQLAAFFTGVQLANLIPARFNIGTGLTLGMLQLGLAPGGTSVGSYQAMLGSTTSIPLLPGKLAVLTGVWATFFLSPGMEPQVIFSGNFTLNGNDNLKFTASFALPNPVVSAQNDGPIDPRDLLQVIPGFPRLPDIGLSIETMAATLVLADMSYTFTGAMKTTSGWSLDLGSGLAVIALKDLQLAFSRSSASNSVVITSNITFLGAPVQVVAATLPAQEGAPGGWRFTGTLVAPLQLADVLPQLLPFVPGALVPNITIEALEVQLDTGDHTFSVQATADWQMDILPVTIEATVSIQSSRTDPKAAATYSGSVSGTVDIHGLVLGVSYVFSPATTDLTFTYKSLTVTYHRTDKTHSYVAVSLGDSTVGDLFAFLLSFAQPGRSISLGAPWDAFEKISLPNLTVKVSFPDKSIEVDVDLDIDLGFLDLKRIALTYTRAYGKPKFSLQLSGTFLGQQYGESGNGLFSSGGNAPLTWDPLNESPPAVPGTGTQTFDLEYLGVGQHLTLREAPPPTMDQVIKALESALLPAGNPTQNPATQLPGLTYDAGSNWLIGTRFTAMSTLELSLIFNDPKMYGLLIQLSGKRAGPFAGLRFEILYRKISDTIGVYHIELTLPDVMRHIELGEVSITLPIITIDIYTNGNFRIDAGFPPSLTDFSRSFSVQVFPFIGYGGFYFAVLNGQTSTSVPQITNGNFSPVLELGLALQVGVGKTISVGILSGGISITVGGMVQGVLAWFTPTQRDQSPERFFHLTGTVAVVGKVYATVDFGIIQASVSLVVYASVSIDVESYRAIHLSISAGVSVEVSIKILFIRISFSFGATITENFVLGSDSATPWIVGAPSGGSAVAARREYRQVRHLARPRPYALLRARPPRALQQRGPLLRSSVRAQGGVSIPVTALPLVSKALGSDFAFPKAPTPPAPAGSSPVIALLLGVETSTDPTAGANVLMTFLLEWVLEVIGNESGTASAAVLDEVLDTLADPRTADNDFSYDALKTLFTANGLVFTIAARPTVAPATEVPTALMAMIPELSLAAPGYAIDFWSDRVPTGDYEATVRDYFADLSAQFAERQRKPAREADAVPESLAIFTFRYYFLMLARGAVQAAKQQLASSRVTLGADAATTSLTSLANRFDNDYTARAGDTLATIAASFGVTAVQLQAANPAYRLREPVTGETVFIPAVQVTYASRAGDTLAGLAACFALDGALIAAANPTVDFGNLAPGTPVVIPGMRVVHLAVEGQSGVAIAAEFGVDYSALQAANPTLDFSKLAPGDKVLIPLGVTPAMLAVANQDGANLLAAGVTLTLGDIPMRAAGGDTLADLASAKRFNVPLDNLLVTNQEVTGLFADGQPIDFGTLSYVTRAGDSLNGLIAWWYDRNDAFDLAALLAANPALALAAQTLVIPSATSAYTNYPVAANTTLASVLANFPKVSAAGLLAANPTIALTSGQSLSLVTVRYVTSGSYVLSYTATTGDTLNGIAARLFPPGIQPQASAVLQLQRWNGQVAADKVLDAGTRVAVPYFSSIGNILRQLGVTVAQLAATPAMGSAALLAPRAALTVPAVSYTTKGTETLGGLAQAFDLSVEQLAQRVALVAGLFAAGPVSVTAVPGRLLSVLCAELARGGGFTTALNMASRFMFNGLRLPTPQFTAAAVAAETPAFPLYALVGQELPVATPLPDPYTITLGLNQTPAWVSLGGATLPLTLQPGERQLVTDFAGISVQDGIGANGLQALASYAYVADRQPPASLTWWHTPDLPKDLVPANQQAGQPSIWALPGALLDSLAASLSGRLLYQPTAGTTNPDGSVTSAVLAAARFATVVDIAIQVPPDGEAGAYLVVGADQAGLQRLLAVWAHLTAGGTTSTVYLTYASQEATAAQGVAISDAVDRKQSFLVKTNLSTESHGSALRALAASPLGMLNDGLVDAPIANLDPLNTKAFLQLLWECSIVKSGGYYLRYAKVGGDVGLPATLFSAGRQATIQVVVVSDEQPAGSPVALPFNNAVLVGDNIDPGAASLALEALVHTVAGGDTLTSIVAAYGSWLTVDAAGLAVINQTVAGTMVTGATVAGQVVLADDSFGTLAARAGITVSALGTQVKDTAGVLRPGALLQLAGNCVQPVNAGDTLQSIAFEYDLLDPSSLATMNARTPDLLATGATLRVPGQAAYTIQAHDTFGGIATQLGVDLAALGAVNGDANILATGAGIIVGPTSLQLAATQPAGRIGFDVVRANPNPKGAADLTSQQQLDTLFNLLGFQVADNAYFSASKTGLPAGPTADEGDDATSPWKYRQLLSVFPFAKRNETFTAAPLPVPTGNPYAGITAGAVASLSLFFADVLGNHADGAPVPALDVPVGYTDELVALNAWPGVTSAYLFAAPPTAGAPNLAVTVTMATDQFLPDASTVPLPAGAPDGDTTAPAARRASGAAARFALASYQLQQADITCYLSTTLGPVAAPDATGVLARATLLGVANAGYLFTRYAQALAPTQVAVGTAPYTTPAALVAQAAVGVTAGYPVSYDDLGQMNAQAAADLLFGPGTALTVPKNVIVLAGETPAAVDGRAGIDLGTLADQNAPVAVSAGIVVSTATRAFTMTPSTPLPCLFALAAQAGTTLADAPGGVAGFATTNQQVPLSAGLSLVYGTLPPFATTGTESLGDAATYFSGKGTDVVTVTQVAMANQYLAAIYPASAALKVASATTRAGDTLASLAAEYGPPSGQQGSAAAQMLAGNQEVPGFWPVGTTLFVKDITYNVQRGDTLASIALANGCTVGQVLADNDTVSFASTSLLVPFHADAVAGTISASMYTNPADAALGDVAAVFAGTSVGDLATANALTPGLFAAVPVTIGPTTVTPDATSTFTSLAAVFGLTPAAFAAQAASVAGLMRGGGIWLAPAFASVSGETLGHCAGRYGVDAGALAAANATLPTLLVPGQGGTVDGVAFSTFANDTIGMLAARINVLRVANRLPPLSVTALFTLAPLSALTLAARPILAPPAIGQLQATVTPADDHAILDLAVSLTTSRDPARVSAAFLESPRVVSAPAVITALPFAGGGTPTAQSLAAFASAFEAAFPGHKLATGPQQVQGTATIARPSLKGTTTSSGPAGSRGATLWVVNFSTHGNGISYSVDPASAGFFGVPPLAPEPFSSTSVTVPTYDSVSGLQWPGTTQHVRGADPDQWNQDFLRAIDLVLSPRYAVPIAADAAGAPNLTSIIGAKADIASGIASTVWPIVPTAGSGLADAIDAMEQQLLVTLSSAYTVQSLAQWNVQVSGGGAFADAATAPRLSGMIAVGTLTAPAAPSLGANPFAALAALAGVSKSYLAHVIADVTAIIEPGAMVWLRGSNQMYQTTSADTVRTIAAYFAVTPDALPDRLQVGDADSLFRPGAVVNATPTVAPASLRSLTAVAAWMQVTADAVVSANAERAGFFAAGTSVVAGATSYTPAPGDALSAIAAKFGGIAAFADALASVDAGTLPGSYTLNDQAPATGLQLVPQLTFSAAKAPLASTGSHLTSLFSTKDPAAQTSVTLQLGYQVNQLEFDIHSVQGIHGYQSSSWLTFIIPIAGTASAQDMGQVQLPIPLRGYPTPATISHQSAAGSDASLGPEGFAQWDYQFTSGARMAAQDQLTLDVMFNAPDSSPARARRLVTGRDLTPVIEALAAFAAVWPAIAPDLALVPAGGGALLPAAANAVAALAVLAGRVQAAWNGIAALGLGQGLPPKTFTYLLSTLIDPGTTPPTFTALTLDRVGQTLDFHTDPDDFLFTVDATYAAALNAGTIDPGLAARFASYGFPLGNNVVIKPAAQGKDNADWLLVDPGSPSATAASDIPPETYRVFARPAGAPVLQVWRQLLWPAVQVVTSQHEETWLDGRQAGTRLGFDVVSSAVGIDRPLTLAFDFRRVNALSLQNGWGGTSISRNANLIAGVTTNDAFVTHTPLQLFATRITPLLSRTVRTDLSATGGTLATALPAFFRDLVAAQAVVLPPGTLRDMRVAASYAQAADGMSSPDGTPFAHRVPLLLVPLVQFNVSSDWQPGGFCDQLVGAMTTAASRMGIVPGPQDQWVVEVLVYDYVDPAAANPAPQALLNVENRLFPAAVG